MIRTWLLKFWKLISIKYRSHGVKIDISAGAVKPKTGPKIYKISHNHKLLVDCGGDSALETITIKKLLLDLGLSQTQLGNLMGLSRESINQAVSRRRPGTHVLDKIYALGLEAGLIDA